MVLYQLYTNSADDAIGFTPMYTKKQVLVHPGKLTVTLIIVWTMPQA